MCDSERLLCENHSSDILLKAAVVSDKNLHVQYFALLKDERGVSHEELRTKASNPRELYAQLKRAHKFSLDDARLKVAVNERFESWDYSLKDNDRVVFVPPVAGG